MNARQLIGSTHQTPGAPNTESDPLRKDDALQEAQIVGVHIDAVRCHGALLFDLRNALQLRSGNAAVLVLQGIRSCSWAREFRRGKRTAWNVVDSAPHTKEGQFELRLTFVPDAELCIVADISAHFYEVLMTSLPDQPPDYTVDDDTTIEVGIPQWETTLKIVSASSLIL